MLVLGFAGSPRRGGNSECLLDEALKGAFDAGAETKKVVLSKLNFSPCLGCGGCSKSGRCVLNDDMQQIYEEIAIADALILASPIYFYGVSAWLKSAIDRGQAMWSRRYLLKEEPTEKKNGYLISVAATHGEKLFDGALLCAEYYFDAAGYEFADKLLVRGVDDKAAVLDHPEHLGAAYNLGQSAARISEK